VKDTDRAYARLDALAKDREKLLGSSLDVGEPPQIDVKAAVAYRRQTEKVLAQGGPTEQKQIIRTWVSEMKLAPERLEVEVTYRIPEPIVNSVVAGAGFGQHLPFRPEVTLVLPSLRGVRESDVVSTALARMYYLRSAVSAQSGSTPLAL
jgi:hypothetical protein